MITRQTTAYKTLQYLECYSVSTCLHISMPQSIDLPQNSAKYPPAPPNFFHHKRIVQFYDGRKVLKQPKISDFLHCIYGKGEHCYSIRRVFVNFSPFSNLFKAFACNTGHQSRITGLAVKMRLTLVRKQKIHIAFSFIILFDLIVSVVVDYFTKFVFPNSEIDNIVCS